MSLQRASATILILLAMLGTGLPCRAQVPAPSVRGKVVDATHSPIPGVEVRIFQAEGQELGITRTNEVGEFSTASMPGAVVIQFSRDRFAGVSISTESSQGETDMGEIVMQIAAVDSTMTVTETPGYLKPVLRSATKSSTPIQEIPQSVTVVGKEQIQDQMMLSIADVVRYVPGVTAIQGENNRDQLVIRGNSTSADFFVNGVRDDVQYFRDLYNIDDVEVLKGPNALIFGRGGAGGVVNRVTKEAGLSALKEFTLSGGSFGDKRVSGDFDQPMGTRAAFRLNGMFENSGTFRDYVSLERYGISPTITLEPSDRTRVTLSFENFHDHRGADRGIPSYQGRPIETTSSAFFGNPDLNTVRAVANNGSIGVEHQAGRLRIMDRFSLGDVDRGYQNFVPGAVSAGGTMDSLSAYNNATQRRSTFNQSDFNYTLRTGKLRHSLLAGVEIGRQLSDNFRNTGYFNNTDTTTQVPLADGVIHTPVTFRQSATDANNHVKTNLAATYVQDQIELSKHLQLIAGLRFDYFDLQYHDNRAGTNLQRIDHLISPRAGLVYKPVDSVSVYTSYGVSHLPSSGDQFSSLTVITQQVQPEKFVNYEVGAKWEVNSRFLLTTAVYRLDRTNTRATDPSDATRIVQTGSQRTNGAEVGVNGNITSHWRLAGGYSYQDAFVTSATTAARSGAQVAQTPHNSFSLWNNYQILRSFSAGLGLLSRSEMFAAIDNTVRLPGYFRADAAAFYSVTEHIRLQVNVQNLLNRKYYVNADNNTNISPGSPRAFLVGMIARF